MLREVQNLNFILIRNESKKEPCERLVYEAVGGERQFNAARTRFTYTRKSRGEWVKHFKMYKFS